MGRGWRHGRGAPVALLGALAILLQSLLLHAPIVWTAWTASDGARATVMLDAFGHPLCITRPAGDDPDPAGQPDLPPCCLSGCALTSSLLATLPGGDAVRLSPLAQADTPRGMGKTAHVHSSCHDPGNPRAPPLTV